MAYERDAGIIREAQGRYREGDESALADIYMAAVRIAAGMIARQCATRGFSLSMASIDEKARDVASYLFEQYATRKDFMLKKPQSYIYLRVLAALYRRRKIDKATIHCSSEELERLLYGREDD